MIFIKNVLIMFFCILLGQYVVYYAVGDVFEYEKLSLLVVFFVSVLIVLFNKIINSHEYKKRDSDSSVND